MKKLTPDGARQKLIRISSLAPHTIKLPNVIFENILRVFMWEPQFKIIKFQKMPEQYFLPWFWNAKKKLVLVNILQITQKMGDSCTKKVI